jgi:hypothetical protein
LEGEERLASSRYAAQPEQLVDDAVLGEDIPLGHPLDLAFVQHVHGFITLKGSLCCGKRPKPSPPDLRGVSHTDDPVQRYDHK